MEMVASISKRVCTGCMLGAGEAGSSMVLNVTCQQFCTEACLDPHCCKTPQVACKVRKVVITELQL